MAEFDVKRRNAPPATSTSHTFGIPEREEKKTTFFLSGDQFGWKSPPCPVVSWRTFESVCENSQIFMSPARSELKATILSSGDHAPRLSSRVVLTTASGDPRGSPVCARTDRKSTRLNSSHSQISYAVFCLKKKKKKD